MLKRLFSIFILFALGGMLFAQSGSRGDESAEERQLIDIKADLVFSHKVNDTLTVLCFVGNFAAQHNGAVITADSAVRYSDKRIECFGNVLINKNTTYAYGERAEYDGEQNEAALYSPIVKVVDEDVTLYSFNFRFNTLDNIGRYWQGGITTNENNLLSSERGYYYSDTKELICIDSVEIRGEGYLMKGDSVVYNLESDYVDYFQNTNIWNDGGEYIYADRGSYDREKELYTITESGYLLNDEQEAWSDSLDYYRLNEHAILRGEIQIDDTTHKALAFGNYGELWGDRDDIMLTKRPLLISYDTEQGDSIFLKADTVLLRSHNSEVDRRELELFRRDSMVRDSLNFIAMRDSLAAVHLADSIAAVHIADSLALVAAAVADSLAAVHVADSLALIAVVETVEEPVVETVEEIVEDTVVERVVEPTPEPKAEPKAEPKVEAEPTTQPYGYAELPPHVVTAPKAISESVAEVLPKEEPEIEIEQEQEPEQELDTLAQDTIVKLSLWHRIKDRYQSWRSEKKAAAVIKDSIRFEQRRIKLDARDAELEAIAKRRQEKINIKLDAEQARQQRAEYKRNVKALERENRRRERHGEPPLSLDSLELLYPHDHDHDHDHDHETIDSLAIDSLDSMVIDSLDSTLLIPKDSIYRHIKAFRNVRIYRSDFQSICDSMVSVSVDTTLHLYIKPVAWNGQSQISSEVMDIYTANSELDRIEFTGRPIMVSQIDTTFYNQVSGKLMISYFKDNDMYRTDVESNVQTIYFQREEESDEIDMMVVVESGTATFYISNKDLDGVTYRNSPKYDFYPMDKIPEKQSLYLPGFAWRGDERPEREEFSFRTRRPSVREQMSQLEHPTFPIETLIRGQMERLTQSGEWRDRRDLVSYEDEEWMNSLGFVTGQPRKEGDNPFK